MVNVEPSGSFRGRMVIALLLAAAAVTGCRSHAPVGRAGGGVFGEGVPPLEGWTLVWHDEFDGSEPDPRYWDFDRGDGRVVGIPGWGNNEWQYYTADGTNAQVRDGRLVISAIEGRRTDEFGSGRYTSARLVTRGKVAFTYGRFEARIRLPAGRGLWPAFWLMPEPIGLEDDPFARAGTYGGWAASGEIDIMEARGSRPNEVTGAIHYGGVWPRNTYQSGAHRLPAPASITDFNVYAVEWTADEIRWYVNDRLYFRTTTWHSEDPDGVRRPAPAPFDQPFYVILNLAVGGHFDGYPDPDADYFPAEMEVDYVRVWRSHE